MIFPEGEPLDLTVNPAVFKYLQEGATQHLGREFGALNFDEASQLLGSLVFNSLLNADGGTVDTYSGDRTVLDFQADGKDAMVGFGSRFAREIASNIDDERELIINVTRRKRLWHKVFRRQPKIEHTFRFRNEPPQYS